MPLTSLAILLAQPVELLAQTGQRLGQQHTPHATPAPAQTAQHLRQQHTPHAAVAQTGQLDRAAAP